MHHNHGSTGLLSRCRESVQARIESWLVIEEVTAETCRQTLEGVIELKILGLGPIVEKIVVRSFRQFTGC